MLETRIERFLHDGMQRLLRVLLEIEVEEYVARFAGLSDARNRALVAKNGVARARYVPMGPVSVAIAAPRVKDRRVVDGVRQKFSSRLMPPGKPPALGGAYKVAALLLVGWAETDFRSLAEHLVAIGVEGVAAAVEHLVAWREATMKELADVRHASVAAGALDCFPFLEGQRVLVLVGVTPSGGGHLLDATLGDPSSPEAWEQLIHRIATRGDESLPFELPRSVEITPHAPSAA